MIYLFKVGYREKSCFLCVYYYVCHQAWVKVVVESLLLHSGHKVLKRDQLHCFIEQKLAYIMRNIVKKSVFIPWKNQLLLIALGTCLHQIVRICATSLLRHLTKIGYSSRFARVLCTNSVKDARAHTRSNSTIFVRIPSRVNWVKLVFPTRKPRHSNRHLINAKCQQMNFLTASLLSTKGLIAQRLKTKYARKTCHVVLLLKAALWSKKVKSNSSTLRSPLGRSLTTNPMSSVRI